MLIPSVPPTLLVTSSVRPLDACYACALLAVAVEPVKQRLVEYVVA